MDNFRSLGPAGLDAYLALYGTAASPQLDAVCAQRDAHTSLLYWFTDLPRAVAEAKRTHKPILSLRLLGRLDEELSCANSRFFRKLLYPDALVNRALREQWVLHWQTVRPVPKVTLDFGNGRRIERTITGNSAHLVLDPHGRVVDALPGLFDRDTFLALLARARGIALADRQHRAAMHRQALHVAHERGTPPSGLRIPEPPRALAASMIAPSKHAVELPTLRAVMPVPPPPSRGSSLLEADTEQNLALHRRVHEAFATGGEWAGIDGFVEWLYAELFLMPLGDPALGLDVPDPFDAASAWS